ncbi:transketolase [Malacoplasma muris]|uniref:transketolase n=1 Tax=Malacoplasma muris TaxID=2119 RepID=UPI00398E3A93
MSMNTKKNGDAKIVKDNSNKYTSRYTELTVDTIRVLGVEMILNANSGHPGIVLGAAPIMYALFRNHFVNTGDNPNFLNRDRFVLSAGHGSALLYATLHLAGYNSITLDDLKNFRQIGQKTAGHPENILIPGVDCTTGPLGQGVALAVGMAIAETKLNNYFKKSRLINHYTYCLFGDGCLQEGISYEAFSIAAKYKLNKLIFLYDSNNIQLDGKVSDSTITDTKKYFESLGLNYIKVANGNDVASISVAIENAKKSTDKPTVIEIKTTIGYKSIYENSNKAHGQALNSEQIQQLKEKLSYHNDPFEISKNAYVDFEPFVKRGAKALELFNKSLEKLHEDKEKYDFYNKLIIKDFYFDKKWFKTLSYEKELLATRNISGDVLNIIADNNPLLTIASADIAGSTKIWSKNSKLYDSENRLGININVGVREFAMAAINSGICLHSGLKAIGSTFLSFSDYNRAAIRLAAISHSPLISVFSHDSITVGEDGPTHQPIEQIWALRLIPNHILIRPCNLQETISAFDIALKSETTPVTIVTSRLEFLQAKGHDRTTKGAYLLLNNKGYQLTLVASGSEVGVALEVAGILDSVHKIKVNVVSMPSYELFSKQSQVYKDLILGDKKVISIEYGVTTPWYKIAHYAIGINRFGYSGKSHDVVKKLKLSAEDIVNKIIDYLQN